jgi:hypothetical protein
MRVGGAAQGGRHRGAAQGGRQCGGPRSVAELELLDEVLDDFETEQVPPATVFRLAVLVLVVRPNGGKQAAT